MSSESSHSGRSEPEAKRPRRQKITPKVTRTQLKKRRPTPLMKAIYVALYFVAAVICYLLYANLH